MPDEISAFSGREEAERGSDQVADVVKCSGPRRAYERFQFRKGQFDRIEIRTVGRQEAEVGTDGFDRRAHGGLFVDGEVVEHHHIARPKRRNQNLIDVGENIALSIGPLNTAAAPKPSKRTAATTVWVSQCPQGV